MIAPVPSGSALSRTDVLPLEVVAVEASSGEDLLRLNTENLELLHAVAAFDDLSKEARDDHGPLAQELARLDAKLRLILRLLGRQSAARLPAARAVRLGSERIEWQGPAPGPVGTAAVALLYLAPSIHEPLQLPGQLAEPTQDESGRTWSRLRYEGLSGLVVTALEKHVFMHHRRAVAHARQAPRA